MYTLDAVSATSPHAGRSLSPLALLRLQLVFVTLSVPAVDWEGGTSGLIRSDNELLTLIYSFMLI